jgi:hypothetical protein
MDVLQIFCLYRLPPDDLSAFSVNRDNFELLRAVVESSDKDAIAPYAR